VTEPTPNAGFRRQLAGTRDEEVDQFDVMDWRAQTNSAFDVQVFPGDHFFITEFGSRLREVVGSVVRTYSRQADHFSSAGVYR